MPRSIAAHHSLVRRGQRAYGPADNVDIEANARLVRLPDAQRLVPVGSRKTKAAAQPVRHLALAIHSLGIIWLDDKRDIAQLRRQQMAAQHALGIGVVLGVAPAPQDERGLDNIAGIVGLAPTTGRGSGRYLNGPADLIAQIPQAAIVEPLDPLH